MRRPINVSKILGKSNGSANTRIALRTYAPADDADAHPGVSVSMLKDTNLTNPPAKNSNRRRFGRAISLDRIEIALRHAHCGNMRDLTDLSRETVETDPHLGSVLNKRFGAVSSLPYEVRPASGNGVDKDKALFYAAVVWEQLKNLKHFRRALRQLSWSLFDGRSAIELFWKRVAGPRSEYGVVGLANTSTGWIHPRRLSFGPNRELVATPESNMLSGGSFSVQGIILDAIMPGKFVTWQPQLFGEYQEREGLAPRCMYWSFFKRYSQRERMILVELFGKPWRIVEVDEESHASVEDLEDAELAADGLGSAYTARMPRGIKLKVEQPGKTAGQVHREVIEDCDKQISKLVLGQTGTTDGVPAGLNSNQASVMQDEQLMILTSDAAELSEVVENQWTDQIIAANFGTFELPHAPMFVLRSDLPADRAKEVARLTAALNAGLEVSLAEAYEISGFRQPERTEPILRMDQPPTPPLAPTPPAARPIIVWPEGASPPAGEQQPVTPQSSTGEGAREGAGVSVGSPDQKTVITVNEAREGQNLPPLMKPDGSLNPDGDLTVAEYEAKIGNDWVANQPNAEPEDATKPNIAQTFGLSEGDARIELTIRKTDDQWCVYSEDGSRSFGCYRTREEAEERLRQVESFKHMSRDPIVDGEIARIELAVESEEAVRLSSTIVLARQPDTVNGSPEDVIERGRPEMQRAVNRWADEFLDAFVGLISVDEIARAANRVAEQLDDRPFARALERRLIQSVALGALDSWFDEESGTTVAPVTFAEPPVNPKFATMPFDKAMRYFRNKNVVTRAAFERLSATAKQKSFTVAALSKSQMLHLVHAELARHVGQGADIRTFSEFFKQRLAEAGFVAPTAKAEAAYVQMVFRTNVLGAYNAGRYERQTQPSVLRARPYWQIRTVSDARRRPNHRRADGLVLRADDSFWQRAYTPFGWNCFLPGTVIEGRVKGASKSFYSGQIIEIFTAVGRRLTVTANHPIFSAKGLIAAKHLVQGDDLVCNGDETGISPLRTGSKWHDENAPIVVEDVFHSLSKSGVSLTSSYGSNDFHGEASRFDGNIEVVGSYRKLLCCYYAMLAKKLADFVFESSPARASLLIGIGGFDFGFDRDCTASACNPSGFALAEHCRSVLLDGDPFDELSLGTVSDFDPVFKQDSVDDLSADVSLIRQLFDRRAGKVRFDKVVGISKRYFRGHVYDLESPLGWVVANGVYTTNCRCRVVSLSEKQAANMVITDGTAIDYLPDPGFVSGVRTLLVAQWPRDDVAKILMAASAS